MSRRPNNNTQKYEDWKSELVNDTLDWIQAIGATTEGGEMFTVTEWAETFGYISENGTPNTDVWMIVKDEILGQRKMPLAQKFMQGHYLGEPGDQSSILLAGIHQVYGRSKRLKGQRDKLAAIEEQAPLIFEQLNEAIGPTVAKSMMRLIDDINEAFGPVQRALWSWEKFYLNVTAPALLTSGNGDNNKDEETS